MSWGHSSLSLLLCEDTGKISVYESGSNLTRKSDGALILDFPASSAVKNKFLLFMLPS
jgi:hypothetical protein